MVECEIYFMSNLCRWFKGLILKLCEILLCGMWKELTMICDVLFLSKGFFLTWEASQRGSPHLMGTIIQRLFGPIPFILSCLALPRQCNSHASWTDWLLENQVFWLLSKWVLAAFLATLRKFPQSLACFLPEQPSSEQQRENFIKV